MTKLNSSLIKNEVIKLLVKLKNKNTGNSTEAILKEIILGPRVTEKQKYLTSIKNNTTQAIVFIFSRINSKSKLLIKKYQMLESFQFKIQIKGRMHLKLNYLLESNPQLKAARIQRYRVYQRLFAYGYLASIAQSFFLTKPARSTFYQNHYVGLTYNLVFADIIMFKLWSLRKFIMRPIYMKRLFCLSLGSVKKKQITQTLTYIRQAKKKRITRFFKFFQYSLYSLVYQSFAIMGLEELLHYIKAGFFTVNSQIITNPLYSCKTHDIIQFNVFYLFRNANVEELDPKILGVIKQKSLQMKNLTMYFLLSFFHNTLMFKSLSKRRYKQTSLNILNWLKVLNIKKNWGNPWYIQRLLKLVCPKNNCGSELLIMSKQTTNGYNWLFPLINTYVQAQPIYTYLSFLYPEANSSKDKKSNSTAKKLIKQTIHSVLIKMKAQAIATKTVFTATAFLSTYLAPRATTLRLKKKLKRIRVLSLITKEFKVKGQSLIKMGWAITPTKKKRSKGSSNIRDSIAHIVKQSRSTVLNKKVSHVNARTAAAISHLKHSTFNKTYNLLIDSDVFAFSILNQSQKNRGQRQFLNQASARFLLSFCTKS